MINFDLMGERLKKTRIARGFSVKKAAEKIGCSPSTLRRYETQGIKDLLKLSEVCNAYHVDIADVISNKKDYSHLAEILERLGPSVCQVLIAICNSNKSK